MPERQTLCGVTIMRAVRPPAVPAGHPYGGMVGTHGVEAHMYPGGHPVSVPATTLVPSRCPEFERPSSVLPVVDPRLSVSGGAGPSALTETNGGSQKLKVSQVLSQMATINHWLDLAENQELQHAQEVRALEMRCAQHVEAVKNEMKAEIRSLKESFEQKVASMVASINSRVDGGEAADAETDEEFERDVEKIEKSALAFGDNGLKAVVRIVFQMLMGIAKLTADVLPPYPSDDDNWPLDPATDDCLMRFCWTESHQHSDNHTNILQVIAYIRQHGATVCTGSGPALRDISEEDLHEHVIKKYQELQKKKRSHTGTVNNAPVSESAKLEVCIRKFENLPEGSEFGDEKYRMALMESLMSQDEDEVDAQGQKTGHFISHAGTYRSDIMVKFLAAVDEAVDPNPPPCFTVRVKEWLAKEENKKYDLPSYILDNGCAWGDPKDPEEMVAGQK
ncbi:uncharacterized protein EDB91DRAFT_1270776 [Suillus paluster]|uniref:uncharacterized protein n=1 Tax=Suillus paluster TaxID=48578 RepID=UPI001B85D254|nr:uncharacterized protein EDB91DRAFT_1270776 [Suillus paluster]KAG1723600.1 hypothetical protein EDB91DRAFT_1270776 [Suillus paluster]